MPEPIPTNKSAGRRMPPVRRPTPQAPAPLPARPQQRPDVRAQRDREVAQARRLHDAWALGGLAIIAATVLIPWLIGKYLLRDSSFFRQGQGVFDTSVRDGGKYFLSDYLSGLLIPGVIVAAFLLLRPWRRRVGLAMTGLGLVIALLIILPIASDNWEANERAAAVQLYVEKYPIKGINLCGNKAASKTVNGRVVLVVPTCADIQVYYGWQPVARFSEYKSYETFFYAGAQGDPGWFFARTLAGDFLGFSLAEPGKVWKLKLPVHEIVVDNSYERVLQLGYVLISVERPGVANSDRATLTGLDMRTGAIAWTFSCPRQYTANRFNRMQDQPFGHLAMTCWNSRKEAAYLLGSDGVRQSK